MSKRKKQNKDRSKTERKQSYEIRPFSELRLIDDFMFDVATQDLEICKSIVELSLNIRIQEIRWKEGQKVVHNTSGKRGIRLDFYVEDEEGNIFDVEMQKENRGNLRKRTRFYEALLDAPLLKLGEKKFDSLPPTYLIFICGFDLFGYGRYRYTFRKQCEEIPELQMEDDTCVVYLNTKGVHAEHVEASLVEFLHFIEQGNQESEEEIGDERIRDMCRKIRELKSRAEVEATYMKMEERERQMLEDAKEEGLKAGIKEGLKAGLKKQIRKKLLKGKSIAIIAEELEEEIPTIEALIAEMEEENESDAL